MLQFSESCAARQIEGQREQVSEEGFFCVAAAERITSQENRIRVYEPNRQHNRHHWRQEAWRNTFSPSLGLALAYGVHGIAVAGLEFEHRRIFLRFFEC
jgi:hypothetical protein